MRFLHFHWRSNTTISSLMLLQHNGSPLFSDLKIYSHSDYNKSVELLNIIKQLTRRQRIGSCEWKERRQLISVQLDVFSLVCRCTAQIYNSLAWHQINVLIILIKYKMHFPSWESLSGVVFVQGFWHSGHQTNKKHLLNYIYTVYMSYIRAVRYPVQL